MEKPQKKHPGEALGEALGEMRLKPIMTLIEALGLNGEDERSFREEGCFLSLPDGSVKFGIGPFQTQKPGSRLPGQGAFYLPGYFGKKDAFIYPSQILNFSSSDLKAKCEIQSPEWVEPDYESFQERVQKAKEQFKTTALRKVVPAVRWKSAWRPSEDERFSLIQNLFQFAEENSHLSRAFTYGYWKGAEGFVGRTPELLFSLIKNRISTMALAGTAWKSKAHESKDPSLLEDPKELAEHNWVVKEILSKLNLYGNFKAEELQILKAGRIEHLYTPIEGNLNKVIGFEEICESLHPTPALGGFPQELAKEWLKEQPEADWRGAYGGPFGLELESGRFECVVLIRGLFWNAQESFIPCGCGIVEGSDPAREWIELRQKKDSVMNMLGWSPSEY